MYHCSCRDAMLQQCVDLAREQGTPADCDMDGHFSDLHTLCSSGDRFRLIPCVFSLRLGWFLVHRRAGWYYALELARR